MKGPNPAWGWFLAVLAGGFLAQPSRCGAEEVVYELQPGSLLGDWNCDLDDPVVIICEIHGQFTVSIQQGKTGVSGSIHDIEFEGRADSGQTYTISGTGEFNIAFDASSPGGLPGLAYSHMLLTINGIDDNFLDSELYMDRYYPILSFGLWQYANGLRQHCFSIDFVSAAIPEDRVKFFARGDANADGAIDLSDPISIIDLLLRGLGPLRCPKTLDANDDGRIDIADAVFLVQGLFLGGEALLGVCGFDESADSLECGGQISCWSGRR